MRDGPVGQCLCCIYPWFRLRLVVMGLIFMASPCSSRLVSSRLFCFQEQASRKKRKQGRSRAECSDEAANIAESCHLRKQHLMF